METDTSPLSFDGSRHISLIHLDRLPTAIFHPRTGQRSSIALTLRSFVERFQKARP